MIAAPDCFVAELDRQVRVRRLVLEIHALAGKEVAFIALWIARAWALGGTFTPEHRSVERGLQLFREILLRGGRPRGR